MKASDVRAEVQALRDAAHGDRREAFDEVLSILDEQIEADADALAAYRTVTARAVRGFLVGLDEALATLDGAGEATDYGAELAALRRLLAGPGAGAA